FGSLPDAFASAANLLRREGWRPGWTWGREARLPAGFDYGLAAPEAARPLAGWRALGVRRADGGPLPDADAAATLILPAGADGPAFLVYDNFEAILRWNRATLYALAVGVLSDRLAGGGPLVAQPGPNERRLRIADVVEAQRRLAAAGFNPGPADGRAGPMTRGAVRAYQQAR
ncbi:MAG: lytic murein transglycosylase, partial [Pseudomonadota bacterium]